MNSNTLRELQTSTLGPAPKKSQDIPPSPPNPESPGQLSDNIQSPQPHLREHHPTYLDLLSFSSLSSLSNSPSHKEMNIMAGTPTKSDDGKSRTNYCIFNTHKWQMKMHLFKRA